ncbi:MAG TPA: peptidylprolyl isomerase [Methylomirabilota bacterium]|nr:peptidylprolyl isomerase [Methylomirabilota bacterium]
MKKILREPLLHFLLLGAAIFAAYSLVSKRNSDEPGKIVVTQGQVAAIAEGFTRTWQRPPTREELEGLIRDRVQEEVYCREAMALGLDRDDTIIRRRLRQKLEFLTDDVAALAEPTDEELSAYLKARADTFRVQRQFTFSHVYLNPERRGQNLSRDIRQLLAQLQQAGEKADVAELGDSFLLEHKFQSLPASEIVKVFGEKFAAKLGELSPGQWQGPVESGYGVHLVLVSERTEGRVPALTEVRDAVRREWANARRLESNEKFYQELLKRYVVTIERPKPAEEQKKLAEAK